MKFKSQHLILILPLIYASAMLLFYPFRFRFEMDFDEGVNLIKAMLSMQGFHMYSDFWSDQPPLFTLMLSQIFNVFGLNVNLGRLLVLGLSTLLQLSVMEYLRRQWGAGHAVISLILIMTLPFYTKLSVSIMVGLPSIALAIVALFGILRWHETGADRWLSLSAVFMMMSIMTKLWTVILVPIICVGIIVQQASRYRVKHELWNLFRPLAVWGLILLLGLGLVIVFFVGLENIDQLINTHLEASETDMMQALAAPEIVRSYLDDSVLLFLLVPLGLLSIARSKSWHALYPVAWVLAGSALLLWNAPFWYHHQLLITIPSAIIGALAVGDALRDVRDRIRSSSSWQPMTALSLAILVIFGFLVFQRVPLTLDNFRLDFPNLRNLDPMDQTDYEIVGLIRRYANETEYLFTDRPMYAFRSGVQVDPRLAVITQKRFSTGEPSQDEIARILEEIKPDQIVVSRFNIPAVEDYMAERNFTRVDNSLRSRHYVRRDIVND